MDFFFFKLLLLLPQLVRYLFYEKDLVSKRGSVVLLSMLTSSLMLNTILKA